MGFEASAPRRISPCAAATKLPTPVPAGSGSKGLSQPNHARHPRFRPAF